MAENPRYRDEELLPPQNLRTLLDSYLTTLIRRVCENSEIDLIQLTKKFNWVQCSKFWIELKNCPVPEVLDQGQHGNCIAFGTKTLLQFQMNLIGELEGVEVPNLSLDHMIWILKNLTYQSLQDFLTYVKEHGIVAEGDFEVGRGVVRDAKRYYIDYYYGFRPDADEFEWKIQHSIIAYGGVLCELEMGDEFYSLGRMAYEAQLDPQTIQEGRRISHIVPLLGWVPNVKKKELNSGF